MSSHNQPPRQIASNLLFLREGAPLRNPLIRLSESGAVLSIEQCEAPDAEPFTQFYAGIMVLEFPDAYKEAFEQLRSSSQPLDVALSSVVGRGSAVVVISGVDYERMVLTEGSKIKRL